MPAKILHTKGFVEDCVTVPFQLILKFHGQNGITLPLLPAIHFLGQAMLPLLRVPRPTISSTLLRCSRKVNPQVTSRAVQTSTRSVHGKNLFWGSVIAGSIGTGVFLLYGQDSLNALSWPKAKSKSIEPISPLYSKDDVAKHNSLDNGIWVSFEGHVYDITDFVGQHPGGDKILLAAGGAIEPFWAMYAVHQTDEVLKMLEKYRIGDLKVKNEIIRSHYRPKLNHFALQPLPPPSIT